MSEEEIAALHDRVSAMTEGERLMLDPIAYALYEYMRLHHDLARGGFAVPNRVAALAAVDVTQAWNKTIWERQ